jgi:hypothetical protein
MYQKWEFEGTKEAAEKYLVTTGNQGGISGEAELLIFNTLKAAMSGATVSLKATLYVGAELAPTLQDHGELTIHVTYDNPKETN